MLEPNIDPEADHATEPAASPALQMANAMARLHKQFVGRGPTNSRVTIDGDLVVCLLEGGYTRAEQTLQGNNQQDIVTAGRLALQAAMRTALVAVVEETLGRPVRSFMSANDVSQDLQVEIFVLHPGQARPNASGDR